MKKLMVQDDKRGTEIVRIAEDPSAYWYAIGLTAFIAAMAALPFLLIGWN
jgi:hypothetical protein